MNRDEIRDTVTLPANLPPQLADVARQLPSDFIPMIQILPDWLIDVLARSSIRGDRRILGLFLRQHVMPVEDRTLERWPLPWQHVNGKATTPLIAAVALAYSKLMAAPVIMGGRHRSNHPHAE